MKVDEWSGSYLFEEKQQFPRWLLLLVVGSLVTAVIVLIVEVSLHKVPQSEFWIALAAVVPVTVFLGYYFSVVRLEKVVTSNGFYYRWTPVQRSYRFIEKDHIERVIRRRAPLMHYGFGFFLTYGWVHHVNGREGLQLYLKSGKRLFFGSGDAEGFDGAMKELTLSTPKYDRREF